MAPTKLCSRCSGTGRKYGGKCFTCNGTGAVQPQARTSSSAEELLFQEPSAPEISTSQPSDPPMDMPWEAITKLQKRFNDAIAFIGQNHASTVSSISKLRLDIENRFTQDRQAHASAISSLEQRLDKQASSLVKLAEAIQSLRPIAINTVQDPFTYTTLEGHHHPQFPTLVRAATCRQADGFRPNIWVAGPAGGGKTTGGRKLAQALGLPFFFNGAVSMEHKLIGFTDANGTYHETPFRKGYTVPAIYQFDDVDSSDNSALLALNAALANGECDFADRLMPRHPDSIILATANTWGLGATSDYVGRVKIDAAFLSRFPIKIHWPYDEPFERQISSNPEWARRVQKARHAAAAAGLKVIIDPRHSIAGAALISNGFTPDEAANLTYLANIPADKRHLLQ